MKAKIDALIRDMCKVYPLPKSEARRRIEEFMELAREEERQRILEGLPEIDGENQEDYAEYVHGFNNCRDAVEELINPKNT